MAIDFLVRVDDFRDCRLEESEPPELGDGQALLRVEEFGLTSNNITYAVFGETMSYWQFFPGPDSWGRMPVWGFASVEESRREGLEPETRVYGYLPPSTHLVVEPSRVDERGFFDGIAHRASLPTTYQAYRDTATDPAYNQDREAEQIIFWPLFYTSFLIDDLLAHEGFFDAESILISSASSKTALIAAYLLGQREGPELIGLTSARNREFVEGVGVYDRAVPYEEIGSLPERPTAFVDIAGNGEVRATVHNHLADSLAHSLAVGVTHWENFKRGQAETLPGPKPNFFFAPDRVTKRGQDWGTGELDARVVAAWNPFADWAHGWLEVRRASGPEHVESVYRELLEGRVDPKVGHVVSLTSDD